MTLTIHDGVAVSTATCAGPLDLEATLAAGAARRRRSPGCSCRGFAHSASQRASRAVIASALPATTSRRRSMLGATSTCREPDGSARSASGLLTDATYLPLACAPDPLEARTVSGFREAATTRRRRPWWRARSSRRRGRGAMATPSGRRSRRSGGRPTRRCMRPRSDSRSAASSRSYRPTTAGKPNGAPPRSDRRSARLAGSLLGDSSAGLGARRARHFELRIRSL